MAEPLPHVKLHYFANGERCLEIDNLAIQGAESGRRARPLE